MKTVNIVDSLSKFALEDHLLGIYLVHVIVDFLLHVF